MPIDVDRVVGAELPAARSSWSADDVILYHLGVGAGDPPTDPRELRYAYEDELVVLPTFGVLPSMSGIMSMLRMPGMEIDLAALLHGEQELQVHAPIPATCSARTSATVTQVLDKRKAAVVVLEAVTRADEDDRPLFTNRFHGYVRGEGGFGGDSGSPAANERPARAPDQRVVRRTLPQQALLYRLSGDKNPLHVDPALAARGGFERPILHGLCTFGIACKAVVDVALGGDPSSVLRYAARFTGVVYPGEAIVISMWDEGDRLLLEAVVEERGERVLANAAVVRRQAPATGGLR